MCCFVRPEATNKGEGVFFVDENPPFSVKNNWRVDLKQLEIRILSTSVCWLHLVMQVLFCTENLSKLAEVRKYLSPYSPSITVYSPRDLLSSALHIEEDGLTLEENARKKIFSYYQHAPLLQKLPTDRPSIILADDTGLFIEALNGKPGIKVRRWKDGINELTDQGVVDHCLECMRGVENMQDRKATFQSVIALGIYNYNNNTNNNNNDNNDNNNSSKTAGDFVIEYYKGSLQGRIAKEADTTPAILAMKGFPMERLFVVDTQVEWPLLPSTLIPDNLHPEGILLGHAHLLPLEEKLKYQVTTHRERALDSAIQRIIEIVKNSPSTS